MSSTPTTEALQRVTRAARETYGPKSVRWPERARRAKQELAARGANIG